MYNKYYFSVKTPEGNAIESGLQVTVLTPATGAEATIYSDEGTTAKTNTITATVFAAASGVIEFFSTATSLDVLLINTTTGKSKLVRGMTPVKNFVIFDEGLSGLTETALVSSTEYAIPAIGTALTTAAVTMADTSNDDITLGKMNIITGSTVTLAHIGDIGTATVGRVTCAVNHSGSDIILDRTDAVNTKVNGLDADITLYPNGWVALAEVANDTAIVIGGEGYKIVIDA